jgi:hypothetical protein
MRVDRERKRADRVRNWIDSEKEGEHERGRGARPALAKSDDESCTSEKSVGVCVSE